MARPAWRLPARVRIFARLHNVQMEVIQGELDESRSPEEAYTEAPHQGFNPIWLVLSKRKSRTWVELTGMTGEELGIFKESLMEAIEQAEIVVNALDAHAVTTLDTEEPLMRALRPRPLVRKLPIQIHLDQERDDEELPAGNTIF